MLEVLSASSLLFGAGLLPLIFYKGKEHSAHPYFNYVLSFGLSILLGDVFLHLLPEAWLLEATTPDTALMHFVPRSNTTVLLGIVLFFTLDRLLGDVVGYLTVCSNTIDNFLHGLAIAVAFNVSETTGWLTTAGILLHELPHEVTDYALLAKSGFSRRQVTLAQLWTCFSGILGSITGIIFDRSFCCQAVVLPLTSGIFLYVSLTSLIPSLLQATPKQSILQTIVVICGLLLTYTVAH